MPRLNIPLSVSIQFDNPVQPPAYAAAAIMTQVTLVTNEAGQAQTQPAQIMRANGIWKPIFLSLMPAAGTAAEQDHMVYGKRQNSAFDLPGFARYAHTMTLESW